MSRQVTKSADLHHPAPETVLQLGANYSDPAFGYGLGAPPEFIRLVAAQKIPGLVTVLVAVPQAFKQECSTKAQRFIFRVKCAEIAKHRLPIWERNDERNCSFFKMESEESK